MPLDRFSGSESSANENEVISYRKIKFAFDKNKHNTRVVNSANFQSYDIKMSAQGAEEVLSNKIIENVLPLWNALLRKFSRPKKLICESAYIHFCRSTAPEPIRSCEPPLFLNILTADYCDRSRLKAANVIKKGKGRNQFRAFFRKSVASLKMHQIP